MAKPSALLSPGPTDRLFLAVFPDAETSWRIEALGKRLKAELGQKGGVQAADRLHVTLHKIGDYRALPTDIVGKTLEVCNTVTAAPFDVTFDRVTSFSGKPGNRPFVMKGSAGLDALMTFQASLMAALRKAKLAKRSFGMYTPHVTLLYDARMVPYQAVDAISWRVGEYVLVHSLLGQTKHVVLGRWPLIG